MARRWAVYGYKESEMQTALWEQQALPDGYQWGAIVTDQQRGRTLRFIIRERDDAACLCRVTPCSEDEWQDDAGELAAEIDATIDAAAD